MSKNERENEWKTREKMSREREKMSGVFLPLYVENKGKLNHN